MEDRSELFNQLKGFSQRKLKKVETKVVTGTGEQLVEKRGAKGLQVLNSDSNSGADPDAAPARKLDLQVGFISPGLLIGSQDVAHDKSSLDTYGITHILNLAEDIENKFEDDYNYKNVSIRDTPDYDLLKVLEDCFEFIDDGRHYGNVLVHCSGTIGLSRSTSICVAYLMEKDKQTYNDALNTVKEARSFVKPNDGFVKQLKEFEVKLRGAQQVKDSGIDDPFALRKKQEIEQEKAMVAGAASVKNRMKMFGATLEPSANQRSKSVSPAPFAGNNSNTSAKSTAQTSQRPQDSQVGDNKFKSMTPEPRAPSKWKTSEPTKPLTKIDWNSANNEPLAPTSKSFAPPPPPPIPTKSLADDGRPSPRNSSLPPPPPPPPSTDIYASKSKPAAAKPPPPPPAPTTTATTKSPAHQDEPSEPQRMVFGRVRPPPMKIKGGMSIERQDSSCDRKLGSQTTKSSLQLPLKRQPTNESAGSDTDSHDRTRAPSPRAALRAAKQGVDSCERDEQAPQVHRSQLNRSNTKKLLNLIKTKTRTDLTLPDGDEDDEINALLGALENESIDNIDWDELGLDEDEVKGIIGDTNASCSSSSSSSSDEEELDEEEVEVEEVEEEYEDDDDDF